MIFPSRRDLFLVVGIVDQHRSLDDVIPDWPCKPPKKLAMPHRIPNVLDALPKKYQAEERTLLYTLPFAETWATTNIVEFPFATVRLRTIAAKRFKKVGNATALIRKILQVAESTFHQLKGVVLLPAVYADAQYVDGVLQAPCTRQTLAT